jgi:hypothetical protein
VARLSPAGADEPAHALLEVTRYDVDGRRVENETYPIAAATVGRETYEYDEQGQLKALVVRDARGALLSRTVYTYEFDAQGNWTKMVASLVVRQAGAVRLEPTEVTYRTISYYAAAGEHSAARSQALHEPAARGRVRAVRLGDGANADAGAATADADQFTDVGEITDKALSLPAPAYLIGDKRAKRPITIMVAVKVDETGRLLSAEATEGPQELRRAAEQAARQAVFLPFRVDSRPIKARGLVRYNFPYAP